MRPLSEADRRCAERAWLDRHDTAPADTIDRYLAGQGVPVGECRRRGTYRQRFRDLADEYIAVVRDRMSEVRGECDHCGAVLGPDPKEPSRARRWCDAECRSAWYESNRVELECEWCGDTFSQSPGRVKHYAARFCSAACSTEWQRTTRNRKVCEACGTEHYNRCPRCDKLLERNLAIVQALHDHPATDVAEAFELSASQVRHIRRQYHRGEAWAA